MRQSRLTLLCGVAGSGKSTAIYEKIYADAAAGRRAYLLVPEQETVLCEDRMARLLPPSAALHFEVVNFSRLANLVFRRLGSLSYRYAAPQDKALLLWQTLDALSPMLSVYRGIDDGDGVAGVMAAIRTLQAAGISPERLAQTAQKLDSADRLAGKLNDLALISVYYKNLLAETFDDAAEDLDRLAELLEKNRFFEGAHFYLDSFSSFTGQEMRIIRHLLRQADEVTAALCCDRPDGNLPHFLEAYATAGRLLAAADETGCHSEIRLLTQNRRAESRTLAYLAEHFWEHGGTDTPCPDDGGVRRLACRDAYDEADAIAADLAARVQAGARYRDFAVICRRAENARGVLDAALRRYGIPCYLSEASEAEAKPLVKLIESALQILIRGWRRGDVLSFIKTGLTGIDDEAGDVFDLYTSTWNIAGARAYRREWNDNPDGYAEKITEQGQETLKTVNAVRAALGEALFPFFAALSEKEATVSTATDALLAFLERMGVEGRIEEQARRAVQEGRPVEATDEIRLWNLVLDSLFRLKETAGELAAPPERYRRLIRLLFANLAIKNLPEAVDSVVIGTADMLRVPGIPHVYLVGVTDGEFPAGTSGRNLFSETERLRLEEVGLAFENPADVLASSELFYFYRSFCFARESVTFTCPQSSPDGKEEKRPSVAAARLLALLPRLKTPTVILQEDRIFSPQTLVEHAGEIGEGARGKILRSLSLREGIFLPQGADACLNPPECRVSTPTTQAVFGQHQTMSQSGLETYVKCPFNYYCTYVLKLKDSGRATFTTNNIGDLVHRLMEKILQELVKTGGNFRDVTEDEMHRMTDRVLEEYTRSVIRGNGEARLTHLVSRLKQTVYLLIANVCAEFAQSEFVPAAFELPIRSNGTVKPLTFSLQDGGELSLQGVVDRVDVYRRGEQTYIRVVDYKTGDKTFREQDVQRGLNLQMLIYLFSICRGDHREFARRIGAEGEFVPAGILYLSSLAKESTADSILTAEQACAKLEKDSMQRRGLLVEDEEILRAMEPELAGKYIPVSVKKDGSLTRGSAVISAERLGALYRDMEETVCRIAMRMRSGEASPRPLAGENPCRYCRMRSICRRGNREEGGGQHGK